MGSRIGKLAYRLRWHVLVVWLAGTAALTLLVPSPDPTAGVTSELLPADAPFHKALGELAEHFLDKSGLSQAVIVLERQDGPLTSRDLDDADRVTEQILRPRQDDASGEEFRDVTAHTPKSLAMMGDKNPLISADHRSAMVAINLPYNDSTTRAVRMVDRIRAALDAYRFQPGLTTAVTGSAGYGHDYLLANERSHDKVLVVTIVAVIVILLLVYRAPLAAMIPLAGIGLASAAATKLTILGQGLGLSSGTAERLFMFVLLYGAGVDYSLLFISRYREFLDEHRPPREAFALGLGASFGAITASAVTTAAGLAMLCFARFGIFRDVGPAIVVALVTAALASVTLVPAMVAIIGPRAFWPGRRGRRPCPSSTKGSEQILPDGARPAQAVAAEPPPPVRRRDRLWPAVARFVTARPVLVMVATLAALLLPAVRGVTLTWVYDAGSSLKPTYDAVRGSDIVQRHWSIGEIAPVTVLAVAQSPQSVGKWNSACDKIMANLRDLDGVDDARGLTTPLGLHVDSVTTAAARLLGGQQVAAEFLSANKQAMRLLVVLKNAPQTLAAMDDAGRIRSATERGLSQAKVPGEVHLTGATAETVDLRSVTQSDFFRTSALALGVILVIVVALLRDLWISLFMVAATVLGYVATLGLTYWAFGLIGQDGLDWEVEVFLFIVLVAVGQDYNIFFAVRLAQEARRLYSTQATEQALIHTGRVISSCGVIMAATLGSMMVGDVKMLQQLGFALALGMLIDTFIVRPLLLPSFIVLTRRTLGHAAAFIR